MAEPIQQDSDSQQPEGKARVQFDFSRESLAKLDEIKSLVSASTRAEVIRRALTLYTEVLEAERRIEPRDEPGRVVLQPVQRRQDERGQRAHIYNGHPRGGRGELDPQSQSGATSEQPREPTTACSGSGSVSAPTVVGAAQLPFTSSHPVVHPL